MKRLGIITFVTMFLAGAVSAEQVSLTTYGTPGLVEVPTAQTLSENNLSFGVSQFAGIRRTSTTFQVLPWLSGTFRYSINENFFDDDNSLFDGTLFDRGFDVHIRLRQETEFFPAVAIGLRDFIGTGINSAEYIVATKSVTDKLQITAGLGWGRLAGRRNLGNPLGILSDRFDERPVRDFGLGGEVEANQWFRGDASPFFGLNWQATDQLSLQLEYSPDTYDQETIFSSLDIRSPINGGLQYQFDSGAAVKAYVIGADSIGIQLNYTIDPKKPLVPGGAEDLSAAIVPRSRLAAASWNLQGPVETERVLSDRLIAQGIALVSYDTSGDSATIHIRNLRWNIEAQAAGRAARVLANTLPPEIETLTIVFENNGLPISQVTTDRSDLEELQYDYDGAWRTLARADIADADQVGGGRARLEYGVSPYVATAFFDPDAPLRADLGAQFDVEYFAAPGLSFQGRFRYPLVGNLGDADRPSDSVLPRVRSESNRFAEESELEINLLTAEYLWRPGPDLFARVSAGYLEDQFGGISNELLWYPIASRLALGVEVNYARQRDFDMLFGFQDYNVFTGHASVYYDLGNGFQAQVDAGRYLAGDYGATFSLHREFNNGVRIGGYFTLTDVPFDDFGEGSFDRAIEIEFPLTWFTGQPSRRTIGQTIQPILRDGGARLNVQNRLYGVTRDYRAAELSDGWGRYLR